MLRSRPLFLAPLVASLAACSGLPPGNCGSGQNAMVSESLYFGTAKPDGKVSAEDWQAFLNSVVTPRFPQGLTVWQASGQWRSNSGSIVQESSYVLNIVHPDNAATDSSVAEIVNAYKAQFRQEAVLRSRSSACVSF